MYIFTFSALAAAFAVFLNSSSLSLSCPLNFLSFKDCRKRKQFQNLTQTKLEQKCDDNNNTSKSAPSPLWYLFTLISNSSETSWTQHTHIKLNANRI